LLLLVLFILLIDTIEAQEMPPRPVSVSFIRNLSFGAFSQGVGGGSVIIDPAGLRNSVGDIILVSLGYTYYPAIFQIEGNPGTVIHYLAGSAAVLTGNNGGTMTMNLGSTEPPTPFVLPYSGGGTLEVYLGGTLTVGNPLSNPPGDYSGSFVVMFIQE